MSTAVVAPTSTNSKEARGNLKSGSTASALTDQTNADPERALTPTPLQSIWSYLTTDVDPSSSTAPLAAFCFMTGFIDSVSFTAIFVWCGFQTGNFIQLSLALARLFSGPPGHRDTTFHRADQQALTSLISFNMGAFVGRIGNKIGPMTRLWLTLGTLVQAIFTMVASIAIWKSGQGSVADNRGDPAWTNLLSFVCVAFMSASLGLQGIMGKRLNTQFTTTIVLTTVWCELMADPKLFYPHPVVSRDHKLIAATTLFAGGFIGRALVDQIGAAGTLGIGTAIRVVIALGWIFVPAKPSRT